MEMYGKGVGGMKMKKDEKVDEGGNDGMGATMIQVRWVLPSVPYHPIE